MNFCFKQTCGSGGGVGVGFGVGVGVIVGVGGGVDVGRGVLATVAGATSVLTEVGVGGNADGDEQAVSAEVIMKNKQPAKKKRGAPKNCLVIYSPMSLSF
jgi:hypothetical protein